MNQRKLRVALLMGGESREREVSLKSGRAVERALKSAGYHVETCDIGREKLSLRDHHRPQVAFIALHGGRGENGEIQEELQHWGIPYTGSGPEACRLAMDKLVAKRYFRKSGLSTPPACLVTPYWPDEILRDLVDYHLQYPLVVKPVSEGSSLGVSIAKNWDQLKEGLASTFAFEGKALVEKFVSGREFTLSIVDGHPLPLVELNPQREFFDFSAKYEEGETEYIVHPPLAEVLKKKMEAAVLTAHKVLGCRHFSRTDLILTEEGEIQILEVNTIPGLTSQSLLPLAAQAAGYSFSHLCQKMISMALGEKVWRKTA